MKFILSSMMFLAMGFAGGCGNLGGSGPPMTLMREQFATLYDNHKAITDVWYMGSDSTYHHFCMEHWQATSDGQDLQMDFHKFYQVSVEEFGVAHPFPYTTNQDQWRLLRPHGDTSGMQGLHG